MTDLEIRAIIQQRTDAREALEAIRKEVSATVSILVLVAHGLGEFTFSPNMPEPEK
ncbi:hypothetical protein LCGC14_2135840 [marine sediment metagenome]|uniref:Uncharacterized protein n=1 Tax=marine sediment metagenome TaxID=412755 RepID=A0A0F9GW80_9ZZZZ